MTEAGPRVLGLEAPVTDEIDPKTLVFRVGFAPTATAEWVEILVIPTHTSAPSAQGSPAEP